MARLFQISKQLAQFAERIGEHVTFRGVDCVIAGVSEPFLTPSTEHKPTITLEFYVKLDPFGGCGTTAVACERMGIRWVLIEIERHFCDTTVNRLETESAQFRLFS